MLKNKSEILVFWQKKHIEIQAITEVPTQQNKRTDNYTLSRLRMSMNRQEQFSDPSYVFTKL